MAPRFEDLLNEDEGPVSFESLAREEGVRVEEAPGVLETVGRAINRVGTMGLAPRINALAESTFPRLQLREGFFDPDVPTPAPVTYDEALARNRDLQRRTTEAHPVVDAATSVVTGLLHPINKVGGAGLMGAVRGGAIQGGLQGALESEADYSKADAEEYARAFADTLRGGAMGAAFGAGGYGVAKGLGYIGGKARDAYRSARGTLADEARAGLDAEADALRAADAAEEVRLGKEQGRALEMNKARDARAAAQMERAQGQALEANKRVDARAAREEARRVAQEARVAARARRAGLSPAKNQAAMPEEPGTRTLAGYEGQAHGARKTNEARVKADREFLSRPDLTPDQREVAQRYVDKYADAVDDPYRYIRRTMEENLRRSGLPRETVERIMRERVGPRGEVIPRRPSANPPAPPPAPAASPGMTSAERDAFHAQVLRDYPSVKDARPLSDVTRARVERDVARVNRGAWDERTMLPERTGVADPSDWLKRGHDPLEVVRQGGGGSAWEGRADFNDAKTRLGLIRTSPPEGVNGMAMDRYGDDHLFEFRAADGTIFEANVSYSHAFPDELIVNSIHPKGAVGNNYIAMGEEYAGRMGAKNMRQLLDELKREFPNAEKIIAERMSGWNPKREMEMRLPRAKPEGAVTYEFQGRNGQRRLFSNEGHGPYKDWPEREPTFNDAMPRGEYELPGEPTSEFDMRGAFPERDFPESAMATPEEQARVLAAAEEFQGRLPTVRASRDPFYVLDPAKVVQQVDEVRAGGPAARGTDVGAPVWDEPLPPMEELTQPGQPAFPDPIQRYDVLGARPTPRTSQPYASYAAPRRSALPPEEVAAAEEAMAARRAAAFGSGPRGPAPEPTAGARPRALPESSMRAPEDGPPLPEPTDTGLDARFEPTFAEGTRATRVPEVRRGAMRPEATTVPHPPEATQVGGPSALTERTRYAPPSMDQRLAGRPSVDELVDQRIAQGGGALRGAFWRGTTGESGALAGVAGLALGGPSGSLKALALRGGLEVVREAMRNPAAKARAIEAFKLQRLAAIRPDVWGRVSATLARAAQRDEQAGTDYHLRAARHALLQTDPAFRAAEAEAAKGLQGLSEDELARRLVQ